MKKIVFISIFILFLLWWWYTFVYGSFYKNNDIYFVDILTKKMYIDSKYWLHNQVFFSSHENLGTYQISSHCDIEQHVKKIENNIYVFHFQLKDTKCRNNNFYLKDSKGNVIINTHFQLEIIGNYELYNYYTDLSSQDLEKILQKIKKNMPKYKIFSQVDDDNTQRKLWKWKKLFFYFEYHIEIIQSILDGRKNKYLIPVAGYKLPEKNLSKLPNGQRPYRANYTNTVHEGWDIDAPLWTPVRAIDDGYILRIVDNFKFQDLGKINKSTGISYEQKVKNLDILRWNQVWLKTMKGDIIFYSHLDMISSGIQEWDFIYKWNILGTIGITGVPDKNYTDYHLHFELRKNPYNTSQAWKYVWYDYMTWDWYFKGDTREYIIQNQYKIFQKEYE